MASVEVVISWIITSVIGLLAVFFMRKIPRSRGCPPAILTDKFGKAGTVVGSLVFLALYIVGAFVILLIMPEKVNTSSFRPLVWLSLVQSFPLSTQSLQFAPAEPKTTRLGCSTGSHKLPFRMQPSLSILLLRYYCRECSLGARALVRV